MILVDLTRMQGAPVEESDDIKITRHYYMRMADVKLLLAGGLAGMIPAGMLSPFTGTVSFTLIPIGSVIAWFMLTRKRSSEGERHENRFERIADKQRMKKNDGFFILPGVSEPFHPLDVQIIALADRPVPQGSTVERR